MQPRKLILQNFGPFVHETIDFSEFEGSGLFLISGKTGAGKTTIFDSMSYALFGETTGQQRNGKEMRSVFASPDEQTKVIFLFEHQGFFYEVARSPEQTLSKKRGTGTTEQASKVTLTVFDYQMREQRQFTKRQEVEAFIQELLQLDAKQFFQIILLPQGEFRNFLIAPSSEKEKLLRNVFGTDLYQRLTEWLNEQQKQQQQNLKDQEKKIELLGESFKWPDEKEVAVTTVEQLLQWDKAQDGLKAKLQTQEAEQFLLEKARDEAEKTYYKAEQLANQLIAYEALQQEFALLKTKTKEIAAQERRLQFLRQLEKDTPFLQQLAKTRQAVAEQESQSEALKQQLEDLQKTRQAWSDQREIRVEKEERLQVLSVKKQELARLLPLVAEIKEAVAEQGTLQGAVATIEQTITELTGQQKMLAAQEKSCHEALVEQEGLAEEAVSLAQIEALLLRYEENQQASEQMALIIAEIVEETRELTRKSDELEMQVAEKEAIFLKLQSEFAKLQIEKWQQLLIPGEPCLVCGSTDHPLLANQTTGEQHEKVTITEKKVETARKAWQKNQEQWQVVKEDLKVLEAKKVLLLQNEQQQKESQEQLSQQLQGLLPLTEPTFRQAYTKRHAVWQENQEKVALAKEKLVQIQEQSSQFNQDLEAMQLKKEDLKTHLIQQEARVLHLKKQFGQTSSEQIEVTFAQIVDELANVTQWLDADQAEGQRLEKEAVVLLERKAGLARQLLASEQLLAEQKLTLQQLLRQYPAGTTEASLQGEQNSFDQIMVLEQQVQAYREREQFLTTRLAQEEDLKDREMPDLTHLKTLFEQAKNAFVAQQKHVLQLNEQWQHNATLVQQVQALYDQTQAAFCELAELEQLSQTIRGDNLQRLSFERYILQTYLNDVLEVANQRLARLTRGRYQFLIATEKGSYRRSTGLEINIYDDNAGAIRRAQTLSGGESFIAALALALSLADVIQQQAGGIAIEALFIDEGFGSLDEESLEMAIEALEMIEQEGRLIGIISHVRELKERIHQQLIVETNGYGQSKTKLKLGKRWAER